MARCSDGQVFRWPGVQVARWTGAMWLVWSCGQVAVWPPLGAMVSVSLKVFLKASLQPAWSDASLLHKSGWDDQDAIEASPFGLSPSPFLHSASFWPILLNLPRCVHSLLGCQCLNV